MHPGPVQIVVDSDADPSSRSLHPSLSSATISSPDACGGGTRYMQIELKFKLMIPRGAVPASRIRRCVALHLW